MMKLKTEWGTYDVFLATSTYRADDALYIEICTEEEPFSNLTVCLDDPSLEENESYVDTNNLPEALDFIREYNLGEVIGSRVSGFCIYPLVRFNLDEVKKYCR